MDELYSFIEEKKQNLRNNFSEQSKRQIVGYDIAFDKSRKKIQNLVDSSPRDSRYYSDAYPFIREYFMLVYTLQKIKVILIRLMALCLYFKM